MLVLSKPLEKSTENGGTDTYEEQETLEWCRSSTKTGKKTTTCGKDQYLWWAYGSRMRPVLPKQQLMVTMTECRERTGDSGMMQVLPKTTTKGRRRDNRGMIVILWEAQMALHGASLTPFWPWQGQDQRRRQTTELDITKRCEWPGLVFKISQSACQARELTWLYRSCPDRNNG